MTELGDRHREACERIFNEERARVRARLDEPESDAWMLLDECMRRTKRRCFWWGFTHAFVGREWMAYVLMVACVVGIVWALVA